MTQVAIEAKRILLIGHDMDTKLIWWHRLSRLLPGLVLIEASSWDQGLRLLREHGCNLHAVVANKDVSPLENRSLLEVLRAATPGEKSPAIILTTSDGYIEVAEGYFPEALSFFSDPADSARLRRAVYNTS